MQRRWLRGILPTHDSHPRQTTMSRTWSLARRPRRPSTATSQPDRHLRPQSSLISVAQLSLSVPWCSLIPTPLVPLPVRHATSTRRGTSTMTAGMRTPKSRQRSHPLRLRRLPTRAGRQLSPCTRSRSREGRREAEVEGVGVDVDAAHPSGMAMPPWSTGGRCTRRDLETTAHKHL